MSAKKKAKRAYNKNSMKRKLYNISTDMKHLRKAFTKLQNDIDTLKEISKSK